MNPYLQSLRLRTLPLSMSGIVLGTGLASFSNMPVFVLALLTTLSLQILSNLSNELGDAQKGTDINQSERVSYGLQAGTITIPQMKRMIGLFIVLSVVFGTALVFAAFMPLLIHGEGWGNVCLFLLLGALAIVGAMTYTLGKHSYGYMGLGDLGVFLFFGLLSTVGAFFLQTHLLTLEAFLCGAAIGFPCVGVLNLNNIRDMNNDRLHGKHTLAGFLGERGGRVYHTCLLVGCLAVFAALGRFWTLCVAPLWIWHLWYVWTRETGLDRQMPVLMLSTFALAFLAIL